MAPCPIQLRRAVLLCSSDYDRKKFRTAACSVSPAVASYDALIWPKMKPISGHTCLYCRDRRGHPHTVLRPECLRNRHFKRSTIVRSEVKAQTDLTRSADRTLKQDESEHLVILRDEIRMLFCIFQYFFQLGTIFISTYVVKNGGFSTQISSLDLITSHTDIHKYTQTLPLSDKLGEFLGCQLAMFHVVVEHIKASILLPLPKITHRHTRLLAVSRETANQHGKGSKSDVSRGLRIKFARVWDIFLLIVCCKHPRHSKVQGESKNETSFSPSG